MRSISAALLQVSLAATVLGVVALAPGEAGRSLLIPIDGAPIDRALVRQMTLRPLADGPMPGSLVVDGPGRVLAGNLLERGIIMVAAPAALCAIPSPPGVSRNG